jgi:hypothetical protein
MTVIYSNPRLEAVIKDWPSGSIRVNAIFRIETHPTRGQRATRVTEDPRRGTIGHKVLTFTRQSRIVDGDDGKTYILNLSGFGYISIMRGDMKFSAEDTIFPANPRYAYLAALFEKVTTCQP